jgi:probable dihydroxyacetone kinase regulator
MTKVIIGESLKSLMLQHPFEKITIKMITDEAGIIRPTFYNYFCDKYEVLEWIFNENIIEKVKDMFGAGMHSEGIKLLFVCMKNDSQFYKKAFEVTGQNSFEGIVEKSLNDLCMTELNQHYINQKTQNPLLTTELVAGYYALSLTNILKIWMQGDQHAYSVDHMVDAYEYLLTHSLKDYVDIQ